MRPAASRTTRTATPIRRWTAATTASCSCGSTRTMARPTGAMTSITRPPGVNGPCEQPPYSLLVRKAEAEPLPVCQEYRPGVLPWSPLAAGWLSGSFHTRHGVPDDEARESRATSARAGARDDRIRKEETLMARLPDSAVALTG